MNSVTTSLTNNDPWIAVLSVHTQHALRRGLSQRAAVAQAQARVRDGTALTDEVKAMLRTGVRALITPHLGRSRAMIRRALLDDIVRQDVLFDTDLSQWLDTRLLPNKDLEAALAALEPHWRPRPPVLLYGSLLYAITTFGDA